MSSNRRTRRRELTSGLDTLEGRELLTGGGIYGLDGKYINQFDYRKMLAKREAPPAAPSQRQVVMDISSHYGSGAKAVITLYGPGTLQTQKVAANGFPVYNSAGDPVYDESKSTHYDSKTGLISILFDGTTSESQIIGMVYGTKLRPQIETIRDADVSDFDNTGVGTNQMGYVNLNRFDLANGGRINFSAGVQRIFLNEVGAGTQIDVAALKTPPTTSPQNPGGLGTTTVTSSSGSTAVTGGGTSTTTTTTVNGITVITTLPTTDQITVSNGELTGVGGLILPGAIPSTSRNTRVEVQGVELVFKKVKGVANPKGQPSPRLGKEFFGGLIDNTTPGDDDYLVFYQVNRNASTLAIESATADQYVPIKAPSGFGSPALTLLGSGVGEYVTTRTINGQDVPVSEQVVTAGYTFKDGSLADRYFVNAYSVVDRTLVGSFEVVDPDTGAAYAFDGLGGSSGNLYLTTTNGGTNGTGLTQGIDLSASLKTGNSVFLGNALNYPETFYSRGGTAGVAGISYVYSVGLSYFTPYNPINQDPQLGIMKIGVDSSQNLSVNSTTQIGDSVSLLQPVEYVMGSVDQNLVVIDPATKSTESIKNADGVTVTKSYYSANMYNPNSLASAGSFKLYVDANQKLGGLSESFYPQLFGSAVIDVRGNLKTYSADSTSNLVLNVNGIANYVRSKSTDNTTIIGHPILHLAVGRKPGSNVDIFSSSRPTDDTPGGKSRPGTRGGVRVVKNLPIIGPLVNPIQRGSDIS